MFVLVVLLHARNTACIYLLLNDISTSSAYRGCGAQRCKLPLGPSITVELEGTCWRLALQSRRAPGPGPSTFPTFHVIN